MKQEAVSLWGRRLLKKSKMNELRYEEARNEAADNNETKNEEVHL